MDCFICQKHKGSVAQPPGGYIYEDEHWKVCHVPVDKGPLGTLFIESIRHVMDFADFNDTEAASFGELTRKIYMALRHLVGTERIYQVSMMEGVPHFHAWLVPRRKEIPERGLKFLGRDDACEETEAIALAETLRKALKP